MIPREPLWLIVLFIPVALLQERTYDTNDWIPITPQTTVEVEQTASDRALSLDVPAQRFPEDDYRKRQFRPAGPRKLKHPMDYKFETPPPPPSKLRPEINYYNGETMAPFVFNKPRLPAYYPPQTRPPVYDHQYQLPFNRSFYQSLSPVAINNDFYQAVNVSQSYIQPTSPKTVVEQESVQLVYVPVENLQDRPRPPRPQQQLFEPQPQYYEVQQPVQYTQPEQPLQEKLVAPPEVKQLRLENIQKDFIQQALDASKLQQQFKDDINPVTQETTPSPPKQKAHQPPLAVFLESQQKADVADVLDMLKGAKSIAVQDKVTPDSPQIFIGPSNLESPDGYTKFPLPYLNNINGNRIERKIEQLPFFVAPVSYKAPAGYSKISLPSPHVGSVVVSVPQYASTTAAPQFEETYYSPQTYENTYQQPQVPLDLAINQYELDQINNDFVDTSTVRVKQSTTSKPTRGRFVYDNDPTTERPRGRVRGRGRATSRTTTTTTVAPETDRYTVLEEFVAGPSTQGAYEEQTETSRRSSTPFSGSRYLPEGSFEGQLQYDSAVENIPANVYSLEPPTSEQPRSSSHRFSTEASYENRAPVQQYIREEIRGPSSTENNLPAQQYTRNEDTTQEYIREDRPVQQYTRDEEVIKAPVQQYTGDEPTREYISEDSKVPVQQYTVDEPTRGYTKEDTKAPVQQYSGDEPTREYINDSKPPIQQYVNEEREPVQQFIQEKPNKSAEQFLEDFYKPNFDQTYISLQDQAVRSLLVPNLLAPSSQELVTEEVTTPIATTTKRSRGRRPSTTPPPATTRARVSNRSRRPVSRTSTERISEDYGARQRFRTRGRPLQNDITDRVSTTEALNSEPAQSYMQFEHSIDEQQIITINPQQVEDFEPVSTTEGGRLEYENTKSKILDVQIEHTSEDFGRVNANIKSAGILNNNKAEISSTARPSRVRTRGRSRFAASTTTSRPISRITTRPTVKSTTEAEQEEYGFIRQPANVDIQAKAPQFVGELRPKFRPAIAEEAETPKPRMRGRTRVSAEQVTRRSGTVSTRTRSRGASHYRPETKRHNEDEDVSDQNYPATFLQKLDSTRSAAVEDEDDQSPYQSIYQPKIVPFNSISSEDKEVDVTEPPQSLALVQVTDEIPTTTQEELTTKRRRGVWKLVRHRPVDSLEVQESQNYQTVLNAFDNIQKVDPYSKVTTTEAATTMEVATTIPPSTTKESIFDTIYEMFGIWGGNNATTETPAAMTTINPTFPEEITTMEDSATEDIEETTTEVITTTTPTTTTKFAVEPWEMREVKTSTSTEVSHETEICFKGRCMKSRQKIKKRL